jgi:insertion element IS1 protein InsB
LWSFVQNKHNKQWVWIAMDRETRKIIGFHLGRRGREDAVKFWKSLPPVYRQCAVIYSDLWKVYSGVLPSKRHRAVGKESGETNHIERFNNTLRQRVSRLGRKTLSFSKKHSHHLAAIWYFIHHYNSNLSP